MRCFMNTKVLTKIKTQDNIFIKWRVFFSPPNSVFQTVAYLECKTFRNDEVWDINYPWIALQNVFYWNVDTRKQITLISLLNKP